MRKQRVTQYNDKQKRQIIALRSIGVSFKEISVRIGGSDNFVRKNYMKWTGKTK